MQLHYYTSLVIILKLHTKSINNKTNLKKRIKRLIQSSKGIVFYINYLDEIPIVIIILYEIYINIFL